MVISVPLSRDATSLSHGGTGWADIRPENGKGLVKMGALFVQVFGLRGGIRPCKNPISDLPQM